MTTPFTPVPATRTAGSGSPAADMNSTSLELAAMGGTHNVLNAAYSGGADPTGTSDSTAAINGAISGLPAAGGTVCLPAGTYKISSPLTITTGLVLAGAGKHATTITSAAASSIFNFTGNTHWWDIGNLTAVNSGGHIFAGSGTQSAFRVHDASLQCNSNTSSIWSQSGGALIEAYFAYCDLSCNGTAPSAAAFSLTDTGGNYNANLFEHCVCTFNSASTAYFFNWACTSGSEFSFGNVWRDVVFEQCVAVLLDSSFKVRAVTSDQTDAATVWGTASTPYPLAFGTAYRATYSGLFFAGVMVAESAGTMPTFSGATTSLAGGITGLAPDIAGTSSTGQTTPPAIGATMTTIGSNGGYHFYAWIT